MSLAQPWFARSARRNWARLSPRTRGKPVRGTRWRAEVVKLERTRLFQRGKRDSIPTPQNSSVAEYADKRFIKSDLTTVSPALTRKLYALCAAKN